MTEEIKYLANDLSLSAKNVEAAVGLMDEGNTIPFIARYRKEKTGAMDDQTLRLLQDKLNYYRSLNERKAEVQRLITEQGKWSDELANALQNAATLTEVDDIYLPYRPKRKTKASVARENGLEPLAEIILKQEDLRDLSEIAAAFMNENVPDVANAIQGAMYILAEDIAENAEYRKELRRITFENAQLVCEAVTKEDTVYRQYYEFVALISKLKSHQVLAINRGEKEKALKVDIKLQENIAEQFLYSKIGISGGRFQNEILACIADSYKRLLAPAIEREIRAQLREAAEEQALVVFRQNLKQLLMQPPLKGSCVIGFDPGYRTGCKVCVIDAGGKVLDVGVVYPTAPKKDTAGAAKLLRNWIKKYGVSAIAVGNGTASKESEIFIADMISDLDGVGYIMVSEAGASVYSASPLAAAEFPEYDVSLRSAVSIARRLQDPLAELVKIDPKSIGVGQYQHDMKQKRLGEVLDGVVEECVNNVGADLNTASVPLLQRIAGISATVAQNIVAYRESNGLFTSRSQLKKVPKLGHKAFEQCAGFLRIKESKNPLDNSSVHPESYAAAKMILCESGLALSDIGTSAVIGLPAVIKMTGVALAEKLSIGLLTLQDIVNELVKPARDPRDSLAKPVLRSDVLDIKDLKEGMVFQGTVRNITDFGAFVDIGVHQDGLVHVSQMSDKFVRHPLDAVHIGDTVNVRILSVDVDKKRISLTMRK
ncbi:MAG: RNA-binding transcriptional accessory protein [Clostridia bacterium]|nr:RNA-binding transcriptional accessory protein [Clostridia bacterium]